jgi:hypothetical protein
MAAKAAGISFEELVIRILASAQTSVQQNGEQS